MIARIVEGTGQENSLDKMLLTISDDWSREYWGVPFIASKLHFPASFPWYCEYELMIHQQF